MYQQGGFLSSDSWKEVFLVLSNIGLLVFNEPAQMQPLNFIPIPGANIIMNPLGLKIDKKFCLKIFYDNVDEYFLFSAKSKPELEEWYEAIHSITVESLNSKNSQKEMENYTVLESTKGSIVNDANI